MFCELVKTQFPRDGANKIEKQNRQSFVHVTYSNIVTHFSQCTLRVFFNLNGITFQVNRILLFFNNSIIIIIITTLWRRSINHTRIHTTRMNRLFFFFFLYDIDFVSYYNCICIQYYIPWWRFIYWFCTTP